MNDLNVRPINIHDYNKKYLELLKNLTFIEPETISETDFHNFVNNLNKNHQILVIENMSINKIIGTITVLIENKFVHNLGKVCHIEDVVIDSNYRGLGLGKILIEKAIQISKIHSCYKTILNCSKSNIGFYEKCGLSQNSVQMSLYNH